MKLSLFRYSAEAGPQRGWAAQLGLAGTGGLLMWALAVPLAAQAAEPPSVVDQKFVASKNCLSCHSVRRRIVGPAFQDIAKKYAGQPDVAARLAEKIRLGGVGAWGPIPMPANPKVNAEEARQLADWVLQQPSP